MLQKNILVLLVFCAVLFPLYSDGTEYIIRNINYTIDGTTRESVLSHYLDIKSGQSFAGKDLMLSFLDSKVQLIKNKRTLAEGSIEAVYSKNPNNPDVTFVDLDICVKDTWNYIALPYAKYDSNDGFLLSLRGRNYNFLGGMEPLEINLDYTKSELDENEVSVNGEFAVPFYWLGYEWMADFKEDVTLSSEQPTSVTSKAELAVDIPTDFHTWQASIKQAYYLNKDGDEDPDQWYLASSGRFGSSIPLGFELPGFTGVNYNPAVITSVAYKPGYSISEDRRGYSLGAEHGISTGRIDWKGNFRDGAELEFTQDARWNFARERWLSDLEAEMQVHKSFDFMGFSSRIQG
ncbi:MAG: hypothetical protein U9N32_01225, partial [Spirochaetota bacterium]|nr:hypothetical protein [Spirochaetota bacterium]